MMVIYSRLREDGTIEAEEEPSDEEIRRYDKKRKHKRVSNEEWVSSGPCRLLRFPVIKGLPAHFGSKTFIPPGSDFQQQASG
jgi:hypothetical protein